MRPGTRVPGSYQLLYPTLRKNAAIEDQFVTLALDTAEYYTARSIYILLVIPPTYNQGALPCQAQPVALVVVRFEPTNDPDGRNRSFPLPSVRRSAQIRVTQSAEISGHFWKSSKWSSEMAN